MQPIPTGTGIPPGPSGAVASQPGDDEQDRYIQIRGRQWQIISGTPGRCRICDSGIREVVVCTNNTHAICRSCEQQWGRKCTVGCPEKQRWAKISKDVRRSQIKNLIYGADECKFQCTEKDCTWQGQYTDIDQHVGDCIAHIYHCRFRKYGCKERDTNENLSSHVLNCPYREKNCKQCHQPYSIAQAEQHAQSCLQRKVTIAITLPWQKLELFSPSGQWANLDSTTQMRTLQTTLAQLNQAEMIELASSLTNGKPFDTVCQYSCGAIFEHPVQMNAHYQQYCPNMPERCHFCSRWHQRSAFSDHCKSCSYVRVECPRGCGSQVSRFLLQQGIHDRVCTKKIIQCQHQHCQQQGTRAEITIHQRECRWAPSLCQYCHHSLLRWDLQDHRKVCSQARPFDLAGHRYILQPETNALIYQRADQQRVSHVCIPATNTMLRSWLQENPLEFEAHLRIVCTENRTFTFRLAEGLSTCSFGVQGDQPGLRDHTEDGQQPAERVNLFCLDGLGRKLFDLYSIDSGYGYMCTKKYFARLSVRYAIKQLAAMAINTRVFCIISHASYDALFPDQVRATQQRRAAARRNRREKAIKSALRILYRKRGKKGTKVLSSKRNRRLALLAREQATRAPSN